MKLFHFVSVWQVMVIAKLGKIIPCQEKFLVFINLLPRFIRRNELPRPIQYLCWSPVGSKLVSV